MLTLCINFFGAAAIGLIAETAAGQQLSARSTLFWKTGVCGGFTTFSTFSLEAVTLFQGGKWGLGSLYVLLSVAGCFGGVLLGSCCTAGSLQCENRGSSFASHWAVEHVLRSDGQKLLNIQEQHSEQRQYPIHYTAGGARQQERGENGLQFDGFHKQNLHKKADSICVKKQMSSAKQRFWNPRGEHHSRS